VDSLGEFGADSRWPRWSCASDVTPASRVRIRAAKTCGLRNFPFEDFVRNEAWLVLVTIAQDLSTWTCPGGPGGLVQCPR